MTTKLRISDTLRLPIDAVTQRISILGRTRSGKSHTAGVIVEEVLKAHQQTVILDPKGDWWGLRSSANGKSAGLPITIMGGKHGDVPLEPTAGALIADVVVNERVSLLLDLSLFDSKAEEVRFVTAFLDRFYRKNEDPVLLVVDEADVFAPQYPEKNETLMLNRMETICRRGAGKGIGVVLISQRSASIHKGCLSQTELMIAHQTTAPQDKDAIKGWVVDHSDKERREEFMNRIPKLSQGTAILWSPSWLEIYKEVGIRQKETYDSSAAPRVGKRRRPPKVLAQVDLERLKKHMAETIQKAKEEDPRALQAEIRALKLEIARKPKPAAPAPEPVKQAVTKTVEIKVPVVKKALVTRLEAALEKAQKAIEKARSLGAPLEAVAREVKAAVDAGKKAFSDAKRDPSGISLSNATKVGFVKPFPKKMKLPFSGKSAAKTMMEDMNKDVASLDKAQRAILSVLMQHPEGCLKGKLALLSGYCWSGTFSNALSALRTKGYMTGENGGTMSITQDGLVAIAGHVERLPEGRQLVNYWLTHSSFDKAPRKALEVLVENPNGLSAAELAEAAGYQWSGTFSNALSTLRTAGVLVGKNSGKMFACKELLQAVGV